MNISPSQQLYRDLDIDVFKMYENKLWWITIHYHFGVLKLLFWSWKYKYKFALWANILFVNKYWVNNCNLNYQYRFENHQKKKKKWISTLIRTTTDVLLGHATCVGLILLSATQLQLCSGYRTALNNADELKTNVCTTVKV